MPRPFIIEVKIDGQLRLRCRYEYGGPLLLTIPLRGVSPGAHRLTLRCSSFVTMYDWRGVDDFRPLSLILKRLALSSSATEDAGTLSCSVICSL